VREHLADGGVRLDLGDPPVDEEDAPEARMPADLDRAPRALAVKGVEERRFERGGDPEVDRGAVADRGGGG
jgi:hypothetical protein